MKTDLKQEDVLPLIRAEFSCFDNTVDMDNGVYDVLGDFAIHLRDRMTEKSLSECDTQKAFKIMNMMGASKDLEVQNLLVVGIFEILTDENATITAMQKGLKGTAAELFHRTLIGWKND